VSLFSKALVYLGLVDEGESDVEPIAQRPVAARPTATTGEFDVDRPIPRRRVEPVGTASRTRPQPPGPQVRPIAASDIKADILVVEEYNDARMLADRVRERIPVVMDLRHIDPALVRRVIDFASGLIYAVDGRMAKVADGCILVTPGKMILPREEQQRLAGLGVYDLDESR